MEGRNLQEVQLDTSPQPHVHLEEFGKSSTSVETVPEPSSNPVLEASYHTVPPERPNSIQINSQTSIEAEEFNDPHQIKCAMRPAFYMTEIKAKMFFAQRPGVFDDAVKECKKHIDTKDGDVIDAWLLSLIDHWDHEKERIVLLTHGALYICYYDFIALKLKEYQHIPLQILHTLQHGSLVYPGKSLMPTRQCGGVRLRWTGAAPTILTRWNPVSKEVPSVIVSHHPLIYAELNRGMPKYNASDFGTRLWAHLRSLDSASRSPDLQVLAENVEIRSWASITSAVHNQSYLGFNLERNGLSF